MVDNNTNSLALPHSIEAERAVLGAILRQPESFSNLVEKTGLAPGKFFEGNHRQIFEAMTQLDAKGTPIDYFTLLETLSKLRASLNLPFLIELVESSPVTENSEHYAQIVQEKYFLRQVIKVCDKARTEARVVHDDIHEFLATVEKDLLNIQNEKDRNESGLVSARDALVSTIEILEKRIESEDDTTGVSSGFGDLDSITSGWQKSDLIIIAARPGMGKTALAVNLALNAIKSSKELRAAIFTLEMSKEQLIERLLSSEGKIDSTQLRKGDLSEDEKDRLMYSARSINELGDRLAIDETPAISIQELRNRCRRYKREYGLDVIFIDYLQLMSASSAAKKQGREREIGEISNSLKALAKELAIPIIAAAQLNRSPDSRPDKRPRMSDLRESGAMEQDADLIIFIYRDDYYNEESEDTGKSEIMVAKNRHGQTGKVTLAWLPNYVSFHNLMED